ADRRDRHRLPAALLGAAKCREQRLPELVFLLALAKTRTDGVDHALERQLSRGGDHRAARRDRAAAAHDASGLLLERRSRGARNDAGDAAAVREVAVGGVDDRLDRLFQQVAADDLEDPAGRYLFPEERFLRRGTFPPGYSIFAFDLSSRTRSSTFFCTNCCWMRGRTSARAGNFTSRTSSSWMTWKPKRVRTGVSVYLPFSSFTMTSANCGSNTLGTFQSRSPPRSLVPLSFDFLVASSSNFPPFLSSAIMPFACSSVSTRMCRALYSLSPVWAFARSYSFCTSSSVIGFLRIQSRM